MKVDAQTLVEIVNSINNIDELSFYIIDDHIAVEFKGDNGRHEQVKSSNCEQEILSFIQGFEQCYKIVTKARVAYSKLQNKNNIDYNMRQERNDYEKCLRTILGGNNLLNKKNHMTHKQIKELIEKTLSEFEPF